jgi:hypothetical protein
VANKLRYGDFRDEMTYSELVECDWADGGENSSNWGLGIDADGETDDEVHI